MSNANRDYAIVYDVKNSSLALSRPLNFYITDKNTSNIFVKLVTKVSAGNGIDQYTDIENASNYILTMRVIKPNNEVNSIRATQHEPESIFQFDLTEDFKDMPGKYICELTISTIVNSREELITSDPFNYEVKRSILSNVGEIIETGGITTEKILNDLKATEDGLSLRIEENANQINTMKTSVEEKLNEVNSKIDNIEGNGYDDTQVRNNSNEINIMKTKEVNVLSFGAKGDGVTDDTEAIVNAITYANSTSREEQVTVFFPTGKYLISHKIKVPNNTTLRIKGGGERSCIIHPSMNYTDNCLFELDSNSKSINITKIAFSDEGAVNAKSITAIEFISGIHGMMYVENVNCYGLRYFIRGGGPSEFPLGGSFKNIYCLDNHAGGIYLGTETAPQSGQSCFTFDNVIVTSPNLAPKEYTEFTLSTSGTNDTININITENLEDFGYILMRKKSGNEWEFVEHLTSPNESVSISNGGNSYEYKLIKNTVGIYLRHLKAVNLGAVQCEYVGIGLYLEQCRAVSLSTFYHEDREGDFALPRPRAYGIYLYSTESFTMNSAWIEGLYHGLYVFGCHYVGVDSITANVSHSIIYSHQLSTSPFLNVNKIINKGCQYEISHGNPTYQQYSVKEVDGGNTKHILSGAVSSELELRYRGYKKGQIKATGEGLDINCNSFNVNVEKAKTMSPMMSSTYNKTLTNNVATPIATFPILNNVNICFSYSIRSVWNVNRLYVTGECHVAFMTSDGYKESVSSTVTNKIQQNGTIDDPIFTLSVDSDNNLCTLSVLVNSTHDNVSISCLPIYSTGGNPLITLL